MATACMNGMQETKYIAHNDQEICGVETVGRLANCLSLYAVPQIHSAAEVRSLTLTPAPQGSPLAYSLDRAVVYMQRNQL